MEAEPSAPAAPTIPTAGTGRSWNERLKTGGEFAGPQKLGPGGDEDEKFWLSDGSDSDSDASDDDDSDSGSGDGYERDDADAAMDEGEKMTDLGKQRARMAAIRKAQAKAREEGGTQSIASTSASTGGGGGGGTGGGGSGSGGGGGGSSVGGGGARLPDCLLLVLQCTNAHSPRPPLWPGTTLAAASSLATLVP